MTLVNFFTVTLVKLIVKIVCLLVTIAYYTLAERKIMASVQRRLGPNVVGFWGLLQPLADGLKLFGKELVIPSHANSRLFILAPSGVLGLAFISWGIMPFGLFDHSSQMSVTAISRILLSTYEEAAWAEALRILAYTGCLLEQDALDMEAHLHLEETLEWEEQMRELSQLEWEAHLHELGRVIVHLHDNLEAGKIVTFI